MLRCPSQADLKTLKLDVDTFGTKFDVVRLQIRWGSSTLQPLVTS